MGFKPQAADGVVRNFRESVQFTGYYETSDVVVTEPVGEQEPFIPQHDTNTPEQTQTPQPQSKQSLLTTRHVASHAETANIDRIPVRLTGGRRAWIEIPVPFYDNDKNVIKAQIDLIISDEEDTPTI
jgi:hypothetical protein